MKQTFAPNAAYRLLLGLATALLAWFCAVLPLAQAAAPVSTSFILEEADSCKTLGPPVLVLEDPTRTLSLFDVRSEAKARSFVPLHNNILNAGFTSSAYWLQFTIEDLSKAETQWLLEVSYPLLQDVQLFWPDPQLGYIMKQAGAKLPFDAREVRNKNFIFFLPLEKNKKQVCYLRVETTSSLIVPVKLWKHQVFMAHDHNMQMLSGVYYGMILVLTVYSLFIYMALRDANYLYCGLHFLSFGLFEAALRGTAFEYLWPAYPQWADKALPVLLCCAAMAVVALCRAFLNTRTNFPRLDKVLFFLQPVLALSMVVAVALPYAAAIRINGHLAFVSVIFVFLATILSLREGYKPARYFFAAMSILLVGMALTFFTRLYGLFESNAWTLFAPQAGSAVEILLLSLALTDRLNHMRREKEEAVALFADLNREFIESNFSLESKVAARTRELKDANTRLLELDRMKSSFLANVSHELRTPLTSIIGFTRVAQQRFHKTLWPYLFEAEGKVRKVAEQTGRTLDIVSMESERLREMIEDLLDLSKLETGRIVWNFAPMDMSAVIGQAFVRMQPGYAEKGVELRSEIPTTLPVVVADRERILQVLLKLLANALKFTEQGSVVCRAVVEAGVLRVDVVDSGVGIPAEAKLVVFQKFRQLGDIMTDKPHGAGLGLPICQAIVSCHEGRIWVHDNPAGGTIISFSLPLERQAREGADDDA